MSLIDPGMGKELHPEHHIRQILVAEADPLSCRQLVQELMNAGFAVHVLNGEEDLLQCLNSTDYESIIIGRLHGNSSRSEMCRNISKRFPGRNLPILIIDEEQNQNDVMSCIDAGATDFLFKPFKENLLVSRLDMARRLSHFSSDLLAREMRLKKAQSMARIAYWHMKDNIENLSFSDQFCTVLDIPRNSISSLEQLISIVHPEDRNRFLNEIRQAFQKPRSFSFSHRILMPNGQEFYVTQIGEFIDTDEHHKSIKEFFVTMRDETEIQHTKERLYREKNFDAVTGLANRENFLNRLNARVEEVSQQEKLLVCYFIGIDGFKNLNDALGATGSDQILNQLAQRLKQFSEFDVISRYATDIFAGFSEMFSTINEAQAFAQEIIKTLANRISVRDQDFNIRVSIGISFCPIDADNTNDLLVATDTAMHSIREKGGFDAAIHTYSMNNRIKQSLFVESELKIAIENGDLELYYQPQINSLNEEITGMEALVRWIHPERGLIPPLEFIQIAEDNGLIIPLGEWVVETACSEAAAFQKFGFPSLRVGINLSPRQFNDSSFLKKIERAIERAAIIPETLELEVTESSAMSDIDQAIKILLALRELGAHTSMDDFGTGFSSLGSLQMLPLNTLKIDRAFVKDIGLRDNAGAIASAIVTMAKGLGMQTIAEGVETETQLEFMKQQHCDVIQGFYYSKPLPRKDFLQYLLDFKSRKS